MSYIGRGTDAISNVEKLDNITFSGTTTYALTKSSAAFTPVGANNILISIDGVIQQGNFSVSTTNIVFDWSPTSSNTCNFILHYGTGVLNVPADGSISAAKMAANSVDSASYVDGSIDNAHIADDQIDSEHYADGSIDTAHLGNLQVTTAKIAADAIDGTKLADDAVDSEHYTDASIDNAHLADDAVGVAELSATGTASSSTFLRGDNSWAAAGGGITHASTWRLHTGFSGEATPIASNWEEFDRYQDTDATALLGSSMTQSSGVFTFPSTGFYYIWFQATFNEGNNLVLQNRANIKVTLDNSNWKQGSTAMSNMPNTSYTSDWIGLSLILDVTSTTNVKCRFEIQHDGETSPTTLASTGENRTYATFVRLGDT